MNLQKKPKQKAIEELDKWFSLFIRLREADSNGIVRCFTCGKFDHWKKMQCGHFASRKYLSTRWEDKNCDVQCVSCNMFDQGVQFVFGQRLDEKYGPGTAEMLMIKKNNLCKPGLFELNLLIKEYKEKVLRLEKP